MSVTRDMRAIVGVKLDGCEIITGHADCSMVAHEVDGQMVATLHMHEVATLLRSIADRIDLLMEIEGSL